MEMLSLKNLPEGVYSPAGVDYPTVLRKRVRKSGNILQPLYEAISNSLEATVGSENHISLYMEIIRYSDLLKRAQLRNKIYTDKILNKS